MFGSYLAAGLLLLAQPILAQFNMYPSISATTLATSLNISSDCLAALNTTVNCDQTLFQMAGNADAYFWADENATALCTGQCLSSAADWWGESANACADDQLNAYGRVYPAETVPGRFLDGLNIVCLTADTDISQDVGINGTIITYTDLPGTNSTVNSTTSDDAYPDTPSARRQVSGSSSYCLVQSYDWVGSDIIRPDCSDAANANQSQCIDPTDVPDENSRIANLYPDSLLCSECFLKMFYLRLASPYLPDVDQSDFMVDQWSDILDVCNANASMPELIVRTLPFYDTAPGFSISGTENTTNLLSDPVPLSGNQTYNSTCPDRVITFADLDGPDFDPSTQASCDFMPQFLQASTGDVIRMMGMGDCLPDFDTDLIPSVCAPLPCEVVLMPDDSTCDLFAQSLSASNASVTVTQFLSWNPNLLGLCTNTTSQYVCAGAPGGTYIPPTVSNATTSTSSEQRGGGDGSGTATGSGGVGGASRNSTTIQPGQAPPSPAQTGIPATCTKFAMAQSGDGCYSFSSLFDITLQALVGWNPVLGEGGANCPTLFYAGYYYCIGVSGSSPSSTVTTSTPTSNPTAPATPSPVQSGINPQCTQYAEAASGTWCSKFASDNNITPAQLYTWNPILGANGANCATELQASTYYCVGAPSGSPTTTSVVTTPTPVATPSPVQSGINPQCTQYAEAASGTWCSKFASDNNITPAQLYTWNPILGANGANCASELEASTYYCVGAPSGTPASTTSTPVAAPSPTQSGITSACNKYAQAVGGDGCGTFAQEHGITTTQLYTWNTMLGSNGANCASSLWVGNYYCVGVGS